MKIIRNNYIPFKGYKAINLFGALFVRKSSTISETLLNHEAIHTAQMKEMLWILFYVWYGLEYILIRMFHKKHNDAYHDISFEEEAYNNDDNLDYLTTRKHYAWLKYVKVWSNCNR